jgi:hypothetical protein
MWMGTWRDEEGAGIATRSTQALVLRCDDGMGLIHEQI